MEPEKADKVESNVTEDHTINCIDVSDDIPTIYISESEPESISSEESLVEEDVVVEEIPVYLTKNLQHQVCVLQYPGMMHHKSVSDLEILNCLVRPKHHSVRLEIPHPYRFPKDDLLEEDDSESDRPLKLLFEGHSKMPVGTQYAAGILINKEMFITPLGKFVEMHQNISQFLPGGASEEALEIVKEEKPEAISISFRKALSEHLAKEQKRYLNYHKNIRRDPWCKARWHDRTTTIAKAERSKFISQGLKPINIFTVPPREYVDRVFPYAAMLPEYHNPKKSVLLNNLQLQQLDLPEQLMNILRSSRVITFNKLYNYMITRIDADVTEENVLRTLPQVGSLILGNWVVQSEYLYPDKFISSKAIPREVMIRARDYILYKLSQSLTPFRSQLLTVTHIPSETLTAVLKSVAVRSRFKYWKLLLPPDEDFISDHPELVQRQAMIWRTFEPIMKEMENVKLPKRARKRSAREKVPIPKSNKPIAK